MNLRTFGALAQAVPKPWAQLLHCRPERFPREMTRGSLLDYGAEHVILGLRAGERTGTLLFGDEAAPTAQVVFELGYVSKIRSPLCAYLGGVLYELGYVDPVTLNASLAEVAQLRVPHGTILQERGVLGAEQIQAGLTEQTERRIADLIALPPDTAWTFIEDHDSLSTYGGSDWPRVDPLGAVWRGIRQSARPALVAEVLRTSERDRFLLSDKARLDSVKLQPEELAILASFKSARHLQGQTTSLTPVTVARLTYFLLVAGILDLAPRVSSSFIAVSPNAAFESSPLAALSRMRALVAAGRHEDAQELARVCVDRFPDDPALRVEAVWISAAAPEVRGRAELLPLVAQLSRLIASEKPCATAYYYRCQLRRRLGEWTAALHDLQRAVDLDPRHLQAARELRLFESRRSRGLPVEVALSASYETPACGMPRVLVPPSK